MKDIWVEQIYFVILYVKKKRQIEYNECSTLWANLLLLRFLIIYLKL
jgi:hypothetical protein